MDLSAVTSVLKTIGELLTWEVTSLLGVKDQVEDLQMELNLMRSFLEEVDSRKVDNKVIHYCVARIRELAYDAEDVIETFALKVASKRKGGISNAIKRSACFLKEGRVLHETKSEIEKITSRITKLNQRLQMYDVRRLADGEGSSTSTERRESRRPYPHIIDDNVVGLDNDMKKLVSALIDEKSDDRVVSICGMGGLGKTTLAKKIYQHKQVIGHFKHLAWVYVSQQCQKRKIWEDILSSVASIDDRGSKLSDEELPKKLFDHLKNNKCLVILDDIWSIEAWESLKPAFPAARDGSSSKFLLTSRHKEEVEHADRRGRLYELQCLNEKESWELFQKIAFRERDSTGVIVDAKIEELGKDMVKHCGGLPLAIIVLGGILATKNSLHEWQRVAEDVKSNLKSGKDVLALSYDDLPYHLKPCFLYLSHFPEDYEIPAESLIQLWVAEGLVSSKEDEGNGGEIMEDVAERYLLELVERCMVQVGKRDPMSKIKTCRMHDLMRDLCFSMANQENFLCIIGNSPSMTSAIRRIVAHKSILFQSIKKSFPLRSIMLFDYMNFEDAKVKAFPNSKMFKYFQEHEDDNCNLLVSVLTPFLLWTLQGSWTYLFNNFKLLRVLDFKRESYSYSVINKLPSAIGNLIHLRFLSLSGFYVRRGNIPSSLGNLRCLQTLDLGVEAAGCIYVPNVIWKLKRLRHLYLPESMNKKTKLKLHTLRNLLTLVNFNTKQCFVADLSKLINLRKLEICGSFKIEDLKGDLDKNLPIVASKYLQSLRIHGEIDPRILAHILSSCVNLRELILGRDIKKLPEYHHFSSTIVYIRLDCCKLVEDPMPTLEKLPNLRILELLTYAFTGREMVCSAPHFPKLESLSLDGLDNLEEWKVDEGAMPTLRFLDIGRCGSLKMLPDGLRSITTLQELKIMGMPKAFEDKVVEGGEDFYKVQQIPSINFSVNKTI